MQPDRAQQRLQLRYLGDGEVCRRRVLGDEGVQDGTCLTAVGLVPEDGLDDEVVEVVGEGLLDEAEAGGV